MKWSIKLGRVLGIDLYMHLTFLLIIAYVAYVHFAQGDDLAGIFMGVLFVLSIFACVVLHEYGHALTARQFGVRTKDITLLPIGGVARLERIPEKPIQEFLVAIAGPAVNVVIAGFILAGLVATGTMQPLAELDMTSGSFLQRLMIVNVALVVFNMLPAFPMDGGRVLRSLLATQFDFLRATNIAATTGKAMAVLFAVAGLFSNPFLLLIALFVWVGATQEATVAQVRSVLTGVPVFRVMQNRFVRLSPTDTIDHAAGLSLSTGQQMFPIVENDRLVGMVSHAAMIRALHDQGGQVPAQSVAITDVRTIDATDTLDAAFQVFQQDDVEALAVMHYGQLVGILTPEGINNFLRLGGGARRPAGPPPFRAELTTPQRQHPVG